MNMKPLMTVTLAALVLFSVPLTALAFQFTRPGSLLFTTINVPDADGTYCTGINAHGQIVGWYSTGMLSHGFLLNQGKSSSIAFPGARNSRANGINARRHRGLL